MVTHSPHTYKTNEKDDEEEEEEEEKAKATKKCALSFGMVWFGPMRSILRVPLAFDSQQHHLLHQSPCLCFIPILSIWLVLGMFCPLITFRSPFCPLIALTTSYREHFVHCSPVVCWFGSLHDAQMLHSILVLCTFMHWRLVSISSIDHFTYPLLGTICRLTTSSFSNVHWLRERHSLGFLLSKAANFSFLKNHDTSLAQTNIILMKTHYCWLHRHVQPPSPNKFIHALNHD